MISFQLTVDLPQSAGLTFRNMREYYEHHSVDWDQPKILEQISNLQNWDIIIDGMVVGAIRLSFDNNDFMLRDIQVLEQYQNKGIGSMALTEAQRLARCSGAKHLKLKVFKMSPAHRVYTRHGFEIMSEDDRFYYMEKSLS